MANGSSIERFLGGSPLAVLVRLLFISLLVGAAMAFLGLSPRALYARRRPASSARSAIWASARCAKSANG